MDGIPLPSWRPRLPRLIRRFALILVASVSFLLILRGYCIEPFQVPTGSMAPALLGHHRTAICPCCGFALDVGRSRRDTDGTGGTCCYADVCCPNCGSTQIPLGETTEARGDHVLVNKVVYAWRRPRRWEIVVFRMFGKVYIKRLIGLAGEEIELADGDVYIDGELAQEAFDEFMGMRVLVFDNDFAPATVGCERWEHQPAQPSSQETAPLTLTLDGRDTPRQLIYRNYSVAERKCLPLTNEYAYNGGRQGCAEPVHDFMVEADVEVVAGSGSLFALNDGGLEAEVRLAVGAADKDKAWPGLRYSEGPVVRVLSPNSGEPGLRSTSDPATTSADLTNVQKVRLVSGKRYHIEMALVDRRLTLRVDGHEMFTPLDLPRAKDRVGVDRPLRFEANGVLAKLRDVRLSRDVHYTQVGKNAVHGRAARLGINQGFVLGDNSANSEDSRFWPSRGAVPLANVIGRAFLVHLPSRAARWQALGRQWQCQLPDLERVRWLR